MGLSEAFAGHICDRLNEYKNKCYYIFHVDA